MQPINENILKALAVTAEICDRPMSEAAARVMCQDLKDFPEEQLLGALERCRKELQGKLTVHAIIIRLADSRPSADEAWAMLPKDEKVSAILTTETLASMKPAMDLYAEGDHIGARMAFKETYSRLVQEARAKGTPVNWVPSLGFDKAGRVSAILEALDQKRMTVKHAETILGPGPLMQAIGTDAAGLAKLKALTENMLKPVQS